jgi:formimidoylglutamate deiminase
VKLYAPSALLPTGWAADVALDVDDAGIITAATAGVRTTGREARGEVLAGPVVPAMPNLHSHAFQRALAGRTGRSSPGNDDSFWTWRQAMYRFLERVDADAFEAIAAQAYVEMAKAGYASVAEFHYVHHDPAGRPYADRAELAWRVVAAARTAGIGLTLLPVFYAHAGFGGQRPTDGQRRFLHDADAFASLLARLQAASSPTSFALGVAPHSLRAVTPDELAALVRLAGSDAPIHIHAAEQRREVDDCVAWSGLRPIEWLLEHASLDARWCVVHATHMTGRELAGLAGSQAVAGLAPTTEADLGDGTFPGAEFLRAGGRFGVGSDSNTQISPFLELRQLEWSQRLQALRRNVLPAAGGMALGASLWSAAASGGAQAAGQASGAIAAGRRADLVVLDMRDAALADQSCDDVLDAAIFGPSRTPVRDVLACGRFVVRDGHHAQEDAVLARYRATLARLR